jgi:mannose-6-phosphate isomerase-like protein (cupin superfamily)
MDVVKKVWGEENIYWNTTYCFKELILNPLFICSYHKHILKDECFRIDAESNPIYMRMEGFEFILDPTDFIHIPPGYRHEFAQLGTHGNGVFIEISSHDDPYDSYRETKSRAIDEATMNKWRRTVPHFKELLGKPYGFDDNGNPNFNRMEIV